MMKTSAWVLEEVCAPLQERTITLQKENKHDVLVEVWCAGLCHTQVQEAFGQRGEDRFLPHLFGHEGLGRVVAVGSDVEHVRVDDLVALGWIPTHGGNDGGKVHSCEELECNVNAGPVTTFAKHVLVSENRCFVIPAELTTEAWLPLLTFLGCALGTGYGLAKRVVDKPLPKPGRIAVVGGGGVGVSALLFMHSLGIEDLTVIDVNDDALDRLSQLSWLLREKPSSKLDGKFDVVIETSGTRSGSEFSYKAATIAGGRVILAGNIPNRGCIEIDPFDLLLGKTIEGCGSDNCDPVRDYPAIIGLIKTEPDLWVSIFLRDKYLFKDLNQAVVDLHENVVLRPIIDCRT